MSEFQLYVESTFELFDKEGRVVKIWNENRFGQWFRERGKERRWPFITGRWKDNMVIRARSA